MPNTYWNIVRYLLTETDDEDGIQKLAAEWAEKVIAWKKAAKWKNGENA